MSKKNKIIIIVLGVVLALVVGLSAIYYWRRVQDQGAAPGDANRTATVGQALGSLTKEQYDTIKKAGKEKDPRACDKYDQERKDGCLFYVFQNSQDASLCDRIENQELVRQCRALDLYYRATTAGSIDQCLPIEITELKEQCVEEIAAGFVSPATCDPYDAAVKELCRSAVYYNMFLADHRAAYCDQITTVKYKQACENELKNKPPDQDGDGLADSYEVALTTNPFKPDTDGDGVSDGNEVKQGRNPMIKGK